MDWLILIIGAVLLIFSIIDIKVKAIPSIMLTGMLFAVACLNPSALWYGAMVFIMAYLLYEADFFGGIADVKVMTMIAFMLHSTNGMFALILLTVIFGFIWKVLVKWRIKKAKETPFIPIFLIVYFTLYLLGVIQ